MDDLVKIYDTRRGTSWVEGKGYGTVSGTKSGRSKKGSNGGNNWSNILTSLKKLGSSNSSSEKSQSSSNNTAHNYYMPFSVIPVEAPTYQQHQHQKYRSLSAATGNSYLRHSSPHLHHPSPPSIHHHHHHRPGLIDLSMHQNEYSQIQPFRSRTVRSPKASKRSSLFDSTWDPISHNHPHLRHQQLQYPSSHQSHVHGSCTCSQSTTPIRGGVSNRYPVDTTAIYSEGGSEKMRSVGRSLGGGSASGRRLTSTTSANCTESIVNGLSESMKHEYSVRKTSSPDPSTTVLGNKLSRSYTTLGGGFMRALRKNSPKETSSPFSPTKPVTAYDLIEQQFGKEIQDDDDLSDNIIESSHYPDTSINSATLPSNSKKNLMLKRGTESVSQSYSRLVQNKNHLEKVMSAREAEDMLSSNLNLRIGGQGVAFNSIKQYQSKTKSPSSSFGGKNSVSGSQMKQKNELNEVEIMENYSVPEPDYDVDDESSEDETRARTKKQPQFSRRDDNHDEAECDHVSSFTLSHHHPDQVAIQRETATSASAALSHKDNLLIEYFPSNGSNLVNTTASSSSNSNYSHSSSSPSSDEHFKSVKKSILKKFTLDPSKSQLDSSEANRGSDIGNCNEQSKGFEECNETNETSSDNSLHNYNTFPHSSPSPRKVPSTPSRTNIMNKLKRKTRKHVTFRSLSDDTLMLEQINEPIMEEEEPLYDDVDECGGEKNDNPSSSTMDPSNPIEKRRMSSYSSSTSTEVTTTTTTTSSNEANDQPNNHHLHTNSPSIGSASGNVKNVDPNSRISSSKQQQNHNQNLNKNEKSNQNGEYRNSQMRYSLDSPRNKSSFVTDQHHEAIMNNLIPGASVISNGLNERILIDPQIRRKEKGGEESMEEKNASIIYKASFYPDPVEYDPNTNPNKDINSRDTRSPHYSSSNSTTSTTLSPPSLHDPFSFSNSSAPEHIEEMDILHHVPPQARSRKKAIDAYPNDVKSEALEYSLKHSQHFNERNARENFNSMHNHNRSDNNIEDDLTEDEEEEEDKYESHKSTFTVSVVNRIDRSLCSSDDDPSSSVGRSKRMVNNIMKGERGGVIGNELKCECNKIVIDVSSGNLYETIQGQDQEHIYEEVGLMKEGEGEENEEEEEPEGKKSIFDGASKDEILEYLEDAKERVDVLINNNIHSCEDGRGSIAHREVTMSPDMRVIEEHQGKVGKVVEEKEEEVEDDRRKSKEEELDCIGDVIDAVTGEGGGGSRKKRGSFSSSLTSSSSLCKSRSGVAVSAENLIESTITSSSRRNRTSNVSNSSTDSAVTTSSSLEDESSLRSGPIITSSVSLTQLVERNDSGVGTETSSRPTRLRRSSSAIVGESEQRCTDCEQVFDPVQYDESTASGFTSFFPLTCNKCDKKRSERREIISEFVETEFKYGRDLRIIREEFYRPVEVAGLLSKEQIKSVFLNLDELINVNSRFSEKLQDALDIATEQGDEEYTTVNLGRLFIDSSSMLLAFETYCSQQGSASLILAHLEKEKELLRIFLRVSQMENTLLRRMNLSAFLMVPVQRVTKYPLLLNRLYKVTPYHHRDREALKAAQQKVELHLEHINQQTKSAPNKIWRRISNLSVANRRLPAVLEDIGNMKLRKAALDALKWSREDSSFVLCGKLLFAPVTESSSSSSTTKKGRTIKFLPIHALLVAFGTPTEHYRPDLAETDDPMKTFSSGRTGITDAALVVIKDKSSRYTLCHEPLHLCSCIIRMESEDDDVFEVHEMNKDSFMFKAESSDIAKQWFKHLGYHSRDLGGWRRRRNAMANIMMVK